MRIALNHYVRKFGKILLWFIAIIIALVGLLFLAMQFPYVQNLAKNRVVTFLEEKIKTPLAIGRLSFDFPKRLVLEGVYFEDEHQDTLLAGDTIKVDLNMWKLLNNEVVIHEIDLRGIN